MRFMCLVRADEASEAGAPPDPALLERMGAFVEEIAATGALLGTDGLHPSAKGVRVSLRDGQFRVVDGPFTESKELIASYALVEVPTKDDAIALTKRFLEVLGKGDVEVRQVFTMEDFGDVLTPELRDQEDRSRANMAEAASR